MKIRYIFAMAIFLATNAGAEELPKRMPGLWEHKTTTEEGEIVVKQCIDHRTDDLALGPMSGLTCAKREITKITGGYSIKTDCTVGNIRAEGDGTITGDFKKALRTDTKSFITGLPGHEGAVETKTVVTAERIGECLADQNPGDTILSDGRIISLPGKR